MESRIQGVQFVPLKVFGDARGHFFESFRNHWFSNTTMVQQNVSFSKAGVLRGMHYHLEQADFWVVPSGSVRAALFDMRVGSRSSGVAEVLTLDMHAAIGVYIPKGVAHGFYAITDATMIYLVDRAYDDGSDEHGVRWNDPALGITWNVANPILSTRDQQTPMLSDVPTRLLPP
jgi:dTDP-4-dehydrorhamnose 3,5-epimerase